MIDISFVIPFRNEESYLKATLESLANQDLGSATAEVLLIDGGSSDRSREVVQPFLGLSHHGVSFRLLDNPHHTTPFAFNIGIANAAGTVVGFGGAHTEYPSHYLRRAFELLEETGADVVGGGHEEFVSVDTGWFAAAARCLYKSPMGAGVAAYHRRGEPGYVDTVYGGFYRATVFERVGTFNELLARNQDNELNARVSAAGLAIYFHPELSTVYVLKTDWRTLLKRAFLFGRYHPVTWRINPRAFRVRHVAPGAFAIYVAILLAVGASQHLPLWLATPLVAYVALLTWSAVRLMSRVGAAAALTTIPLFCVYHLCYGTGTLVGIAGAVRAPGRSANTLAATLASGRPRTSSLDVVP